MAGEFLHHLANFCAEILFVAGCVKHLQKLGLQADFFALDFHWRIFAKNFYFSTLFVVTKCPHFEEIW